MGVIMTCFLCLNNLPVYELELLSKRSIFYFIIIVIKLKNMTAAALQVILCINSSEFSCHKIRKHSMNNIYCHRCNFLWFIYFTQLWFIRHETEFVYSQLYWSIWDSSGTWLVCSTQHLASISPLAWQTGNITEPYTHAFRPGLSI